MSKNKSVRFDFLDQEAPLYRTVVVEAGTSAKSKMIIDGFTILDRNATRTRIRVVGRYEDRRYTAVTQLDKNPAVPPVSLVDRPEPSEEFAAALHAELARKYPALIYLEVGRFLRAA